MKTCPYCAESIPDAAAQCPQCQSDLTAAAPPLAVVPTSGKAVASLVLGLLGFLGITGILALVLGALARRDIARSQGGVTGKGVATVGMVLGGLGLALFLLAAVAIPNLLRSRMAAGESAVVGNLRTINTACVAYSSMHPERGFPRTLAELGSKGDALLDDTLAGGQKTGYIFNYQPGPPDRDGRINTYQVTANPLRPEETGRRYFFTDESAVIRMSRDGPATATSPPLY